MSEWCVHAYYTKLQTIKKAIGSKDEDLLNNVLNKDIAGVISDFKDNGFSDSNFEIGMSLEDTIESLIYNNISEGFHTKYALSLWTIIAELSITRPDNPVIEYPFFAHYEIDHVLEMHKIYPNLLKVFKSLKGHQLNFELPINMNHISDMPRFVYIEKQQLKALISEGLQMKTDIENNQDWVSDLTETQDIEQILNWIIEAHKKQLSMCLVLDGDV